MTKALVLTALAVTLVLATVWIATGAEGFTRFEVVERVQVPVAETDLLAGLDFYDEPTREQTVERDEFRLGLFPAPSSLFDRHMLSVVSIATPLWLAALFVAWRRRRQQASDGAALEKGLA